LNQICWNRTSQVAKPWLRHFVAGFSLWRTKFNPRTIYVGFVADRVSLWRVSLRVLQFSPCQNHSANAPRSFVYHWCYI